MMLLVYNICSEGCRTLGPGNRFVIWTQGCLRKCKGCITPESQSLTDGQEIEIQTIENQIIDNQHISGITISGGEPFLQAEELYKLLSLVKKQRPELTVIIFTGFTIKELNWQSAINLLSLTDLLIDGPYIDSLNDGRGLRGSSNQKFHFLTNRLLPYKTEMEMGKRQVEIYIYPDKIVKYGIPIKNL